MRNVFEFMYILRTRGKTLATIPEGHSGAGNGKESGKDVSMEPRKEFSMESIKIRFGNADEVWKFVNTIRRFNGEYDLAAGSYTVDAKSILGVCALGTGKALDLKLVNPKGEEQQLLTALHEYLVSK